jgi:multidrug efflux system membrane fusion protein
VLTKVMQDTVVVPAGAIQRGPNGFFVYVVGADQRAAQRPVTVGPIAGGRAVIMKGVAADEQVVTAGQYRLAPGLLVTATEKQPSPDAQQKG